MRHAPLAAFYFFYFASLGTLIPYWGLYLLDLGFRPLDVGIAFSVLMSTKIVAPLVWGTIADFWGRRLLLIRMATLAAVIAFIAISQVEEFLPLLIILAIYGFFWNAALPQFEALTFNHLAEDEFRYGRVRLWGSVGFIVAVVGCGALIDVLGIENLPWIIVVVTAGIFVSSLLTYEPAALFAENHSVAQGFLVAIKKPEVMALMLVCCLSQICHGPYYSFFSIYMQDFGYSETAIGMFWALGVLAEIAVFIYMPQLLRGVGPRHLMVAAMALTALRWLMLATVADQVLLLLFAQILHMASFGLYHAVAIHLIHQFFPGKLQGRGQALYSSVSFGLGGAIGGLFGGWVWDSSPGSLVFYLSAAIATLAVAVAWFGLKAEKNNVA